MNKFFRIFNITIFCFFITLKSQDTHKNQENSHTEINQQQESIKQVEREKIFDLRRQLLISHLDKQSETKEGFAQSTLVKTTDGYIPINQLQANDYITDINNQSTQQVILVEFAYVTHAYEIITTHARICAAPHQLLYDAILDTFICAKDITTQHHLGSQPVLECTKIHEIQKVYRLTTQNHYFLVNDNVVAHNADISKCLDVLSIGLCCLQHPVPITIGRTISLAKYALWLYRTCKTIQTHSLTIIEAMNNEDVVTQTRAYYESRRIQLLDLLNQYRNLQQTISVVSKQSPITALLFSGTTNSLTNQSLLPSLQTELTYSASEKEKLLNLREQDLTRIEKEITNIQITLMLHFQDHGDRVTEVFHELDPAYNALQANLKIQIPYGNKNLAVNLAYQRCNYMLTLLEAIETLEYKSSLLEQLIQFYQHPQNALLLKNSTNILDLCSNYQETLQQIKGFLPQLKLYTVRMQQFIYNATIPYGYINNNTIASIQQQLYALRNNKEKTNNSNAQIKQSHSYHATPPHDPDDDEDKTKKFDHTNHPHDDTKNKFSENVQKARHGLREDEGHLPDTPKNRSIFLELVRNKNNRICLDKDENMWYARIEHDGSQLWATVRIKNSEIQNCGLNKTPRLTNITTGLNKSLPNTNESHK